MHIINFIEFSMIRRV